MEAEEAVASEVVLTEEALAVDAEADLVEDPTVAEALAEVTMVITDITIITVITDHFSLDIEGLSWATDTAEDALAD